MMDRSHSPRADSRGSFQSNSNNKEQASALSALFSSEMKMSYDARKEDEMEEKSLAIGSVGPPMPLSSSYHESYNYATASSSSASASFTGQSYNYAANSFYQSYGDSYQSLPKSLAAYGKKTEDESNGVSNGECKAGAKPLVSVKELLTIILEDATYKQDSDHNNNNNNNSNSAANSVGSAIDARLLLNGDVDVHSKIESLALLPAEEDGSPMEDLPDCTAQSDILNMGVKDFIILDKRSKIQLVHIRIEGNLAPNDPYEGVLPQNNQIQVVSEDDRPGLLQREESQQTIESNEDSYYTLDDDRDSWKDPDSIQFFRTDTDEIKLHELQRIMEEEKKQQQKAVEKPNKAHRHRSSSGNLVISYRRPNSQRWRVAKKLALLSEQLLIDHHHHTTGSPSSRLTSNDLRKSEIAQEVRKKLFEHQTQAVPIPDPRYNNQNHNLNKSYELPEQSSTTVNEGGGLDRRHSERPYDEERDGEFDQLKYSSKKDRDKDRDRDRDRSSRASSRASSFMDLNPHTSISLSAQFSPAGSEVMSSRDLDDSDDDQLGLIQLERSNYILSSASSTSNYTKRSLGRDESTYAHPFKSGSSGGHHNHNQNPVSPRHAAASRIRIGSFTKGEIPEMQGSPRRQHPRLPHRGSGASGNLDLNAKSILSMSDSEHSDSDDSDASSVDEDRFPIRQIHVNTDFKAITSNNNHNSSNNHQSPMRRSPSKLNPFRSPSMYEKEGGGDANSDNGSTRSSVTSNKSMISRLYDLFGTRRRSSFASESNDSVHSGPTTPHQRRSEIGSDAGGGGGGGYERPSLVLSRQISLPIIQNLDTGEAFPIGALRYEAFKLPETVSPTVLFGKPSDKIHR